MSLKHGAFSAEAARLYGSVIWSTPDGGEVEITATTDESLSNYHWGDKKYVGLVVSYLRIAKKRKIYEQ